MIPAKAESYWCILNIAEISQLNPQGETTRYRERFQLKSFIQKFAEFPVGDQEWEGETPDLIVKTVSGRLGLEHTTLYTDDSTNGSRKKKGSHKKNQESLQWSVVDSALTEYAKSELPAVSAEVWFDVAVPLTQKTYKSVATDLAHAAQDIVSMPGSRDIEDFRCREYERRFVDPLPLEILRIHLHREPRTEYVVWYPEIPWVVSELKVLNIQETIQQKERNLSECRTKCDELYLLIASEGLYPSSNFALTDEVRSHAFQTRFDRVFYFDSLSGDILELNRAS